MHDVCAAHGVPVWCAACWRPVSAAANVALASLPGFTLPGDTSASNRFYRTDITEPFVLDSGHLPVPTGSRSRRHPDPGGPGRATVDKAWLTS